MKILTKQQVLSLIMLTLTWFCIAGMTYIVLGSNMVAFPMYLALLAYAGFIFWILIEMVLRNKEKKEDVSDD